MPKTAPAGQELKISGVSGTAYVYGPATAIKTKADGELVITGDQSKMHSVEKARAYQRLIPNSRLVVIQSDAYHIAAANAEECVRLTLAFLREQSKS